MANLANKIKKGLLLLTVPALVGCSTTNYFGREFQDDVYYNPKEIVIYEDVKSRSDLDRLDKKTTYDFWRWKFVHSPYSSSLGWDSDGDGIINADDPWPYEWGPFVDMNGNGLVDFTDWDVSGLRGPSLSLYVFHDFDRWWGININPWWANRSLFWNRQVWHNHNNWNYHYYIPNNNSWNYFTQPKRDNSRVSYERRRETGTNVTRSQTRERDLYKPRVVPQRKETKKTSTYENRRETKNTTDYNRSYRNSSTQNIATKRTSDSQRNTQKTNSQIQRRTTTSPTNNDSQMSSAPQRNNTQIRQTPARSNTQTKSSSSNSRGSTSGSSQRSSSGRR